jgi:hypothetical protein
MGAWLFGYLTIPHCEDMDRKGRLAEMKIRVDIDCTPEEARSFLGLPDLGPMQQRWLKEIQERMTAALQAMDPTTMMDTWLPSTVKGFERMQEMFLSQMGSGKRRDK